MGSESANNAAKSDFWIQDASYLRLKNAQIGYVIPQKWVNNIGIQNMRLFVSAQNPLTFTKMKGGWDPSILQTVVDVLILSLLRLFWFKY